MNINDFRKFLYLNSQSFTSYNEGHSTVLAGILRDIGYKYSVILPDEKLSEVNKVYRKFTTIMNLCVGIEILLYLYLVIFPFFTEFMKLPYFVAALIMAFIPLIGLYLTYVVINTLYENYLTRYVGTFSKTKFKPDLKNITEENFQKYLKTSRKSKYVLLLLILLFCFYALTPSVINNLLRKEKYQSAINTANIYLKVIPISSESYAQRAYSEFKLKNYEKAIKDYKLANKYSLSNTFDRDIIGVKTYYMSENEVMKEFDKLLAQKQDGRILCEKANYLLRNKKYSEAIKVYNTLEELYEEQPDFQLEQVYHNRALAKQASGDISGAKIDMNISKRMCPECSFDLNQKLIQIPE